MKVVVCKNCGAKYQLDDAEDITEFECSICTGSLEELDASNKTKNSQSEGYENSYNQNYESDSVIVCCQDCGLKFKLDRSDDIREYECVSCDGSLRYLDNKLNEMYGLSPLSEIVEDSNHEVEIIDENSSILDSTQSTGPFNDEIIVEHDVVPDEVLVQDVEVVEPVDEIIVEHDVVPEQESVVEFEPVDEIIVEHDVVPEETVEVEEVETPNLDTKHLSQNSNKIIDNKNTLTFNSIEEYEEYKATLFKVYNALKESIKREYIADLDKQVAASHNKSMVNKQKIKQQRPKQQKHKQQEPKPLPLDMEYGGMSYKDLPKSEGGSSNMYLLPLIIGIVLIIAGVILFILLSQTFALALVVLGILLLIFGIVASFDRNEKEIRTRIIREKLEELPNDFYLFYFTKPPYAKDGLNHVIVGPTGIYTILTQRYSSKGDKNKQKFDAENDDLMAGPSDIQNYMDNRNRLELTGGYDDHQTRFQFGNEEIQFDYNNRIKHKSLTLNEDLAIFLDKNGISGIYIEPLIGFINEDVAIINVVLTNEDLFLEELLNKIANGPRRLDQRSVVRIAALLSKYSVNCGMEY